MQRHSKSILIKFDQLSAGLPSILMMVAPPQIAGIAGERAYELRPSMPGRLMVLLLAVSAGVTLVLDVRVGSSIKARSPVRTVLLTLVLVFCIGLQQSVSAQQPGMSVPVANAPLSIDQVAETWFG